MWTILQILVPTDLSAPAEKALEYAVDLAVHHGASVTVLNASDASLRDYYPGGFEADREAMEKLVAARKPDATTMKIIQRDGPAAKAILRAASELDVDLIVMGTHGRTGLGRVAVGSVTEEVVRLADVPVLTVSPHTSAAESR